MRPFFSENRYEGGDFLFQEGCKESKKAEGFDIDFWDGVFSSQEIFFRGDKSAGLGNLSQ